ncbi:RNA polymerase sigma factor [Paenibacillus sp. N1-5-1-14]|uniref:RNA polymerase sigma factor n=1 Tax=Paenibacillus radicibacter TaxID=2972488 RepID=UPI00215917E7|nr:RNA polymerase sigma factor [Paenibacillus radicibacter]MCR8646011.1 RNA polymerase sigma factor [Paenibacillus radicibacter]
MNQKSEELEIDIIVAQVKNGNKEAFRTLVCEYQRKIHVYSYHMLRNKEEAEDAVQEIFLKCYQNIHQYAQGTSFSGWLYTVAYNHCINLLKKRSLRHKLIALYRTQLAQAKQEVDYASLSVHDVLDLLSAEDRNLLVLRVWEDQSFDEISRIMNCKPTTVRKRFERIRKKLKMKIIQLEECSNVPKTAFRR